MAIEQTNMKSSGTSKRSRELASAPLNEAEARKEKRREYLHRYYREHREVAREYQRNYNLTHRKKQRVGQMTEFAGRQKIQHAYTIRDIMQLPAEKAIKALDMICRGERVFTM